jgi:hypothetical protein
MKVTQRSLGLKKEHRVVAGVSKVGIQLFVVCWSIPAVKRVFVQIAHGPRPALPSLAPIVQRADPCSTSSTVCRVASASRPISVGPAVAKNVNLAIHGRESKQGGAHLGVINFILHTGIQAQPLIESLAGV